MKEKLFYYKDLENRIRGPLPLSDLIDKYHQQMIHEHTCIIEKGTARCVCFQDVFPVGEAGACAVRPPIGESIPEPIGEFGESIGDPITEPIPELDASVLPSPDSSAMSSPAPPSVNDKAEGDSPFFSRLLSKMAVFLKAVGTVSRATFVCYQLLIFMLIVVPLEFVATQCQYCRFEPGTEDILVQCMLVLLAVFRMIVPLGVMARFLFCPDQEDVQSDGTWVDSCSASVLLPWLCGLFLLFIVGAILFNARVFQRRLAIVGLSRSYILLALIPVLGYIILCLYCLQSVKAKKVSNEPIPEISPAES